MRCSKTGIYVIGFLLSCGARGDRPEIRVQISAAHEREHLDRAVAAFEIVGRKLGVVWRTER